MIYLFENYAFDPNRRELRRGTDLVAVEPQVFDLLQYLIRNRERVVSKDDMIAAVWKGRIVSESALTSRLTAARHAVGDSGEQQRLIRTFPRKGHRFVGEVREERQPADPPAKLQAAHERPSVGVLPFTNMSAEPDQEFFADGITEDLIAALCRLRGFFVIARNTMFTYKGKPLDVRTVGRELGVRYMLEGSTRKSGTRIRVTAQLIEAATGNQLWSERYDRQVEDVFQIQDDITTSVVGCIGPQLLAAEHSRISRKVPQSLNAWECVVRALFLSSQQSEEDSRAAIDLLDRALADDPDYAQAAGIKAWILIFRAFQGWEEMGEALRNAMPLISAAIAADKDEPWPYLAQGMAGFAMRDNHMALHALTQAVTLSPNMVNAHGLLGIAHAFGGRPQQAIASIDKAVRLSPRDTFLSDFELYYAFAHFQAALYGSGLQHALQSHRLRPGHPYPLLIATACAGLSDRSALAAGLLRELKAVMPAVSPAWIEATSPYVHSEDRARLVEGLQRAGLS